MKKLALVLAVLVAAATLSFAAPANASYPGSVHTTCHIAHFKKKSHHTAVRPRVWVTASGPLKVTGKITVRVGKRSVTQSYHGGAPQISLGKFKKGKHTIHFTYKPKSGSVFKGCSGTGTVKLT